jgi:coatomer protein complex subunit epsilon
MDPDDLYTLRNLFWMGNYQLAINESNGMRNVSANLLNEKKEFLYRSYLALGQHDIVLGEVGGDACAGTLPNVVSFWSLKCSFSLSLPFPPPSLFSRL